MANWEDLPDEIVVFIFRLLEESDLVRASCASKRLRKLYHDPCLWRSRVFELRGYCRSQTERLQSLTKYVDTMGRHLRELRIICPSLNLLTAHNVAQCIKLLLTKLTSLEQGRKSLHAFHMSYLHFNETWDYFRSSKWLLVASITSFLESQKNLRSFDMSYSYMTPPFAYRIMNSLIGSKSSRTLETLNIEEYYTGTCFRIIGTQLRTLSYRCRNLREISLNYSYLYWMDVLVLCRNLEHRLEKLNLHLSFVEYSRQEEIIPSNSWKLARDICPRLKVKVHMADWPRDPTKFLTHNLPLTQLFIKGGQCRCSASTFGEKTTRLLKHLVRHFSSSLQDVSFSVDSSEVCVCRPSREKLTHFLKECQSIRWFVFSDFVASPEFINKVKNANTYTSPNL